MKKMRAAFLLLSMCVAISGCGETNIEYINPGEVLELGNVDINVVSTKAFSSLQCGDDSLVPNPGYKIVVGTFKITNTSDEDTCIDVADFTCYSDNSTEYVPIEGLSDYYKNALNEEFEIKASETRKAIVAWEVEVETEYLETIWTFEETGDSYAIVWTDSNQKKFCIYNEKNEYEGYKKVIKTNIQIDLGSDFVELEYPGSWISWDELKIVNQERIGDEIEATISGKGTIYKKSGDHYVEFINIRAYDKDGYKVKDDTIYRVPHDEGKELPFRIESEITLPAETVRAEIYYE